MSDRFNGRAGGITAPATHGFAITPADATDLAAETRAIYVGGAGSVAVTLASGDTITLAGVLAGTLLPVRASRVRSTGTTATDLVGLY
jgi:hypothetical protein